ncbi:hypothetical protein [Acetobacter vaccinii]|uniref:Uncharacterized protein n=1 Tax=Acetobacter vaccinii TaxID=2592655 RepID=A0A5C1YT06_9PROT|nr:hypothetical protein [Acetobacter vaccinii]QEO18845.1 hypothetical protein FLP30_13325 [Acetobacter vaccinii]
MSEFELKIVSLSMYKKISHISSNDLDKARLEISRLTNADYPNSFYKKNLFWKNDYKNEIKKSIIEINKFSCNILGWEFDEKFLEIDSDIIKFIEDEEKRRSYE